MKDYKRARRIGSLVLAAVVVVLTLSVMAHATQVITTPNAAFVSYSLAAGASSAPITPKANQAVLVMGTTTNFVDIGEGEVTMQANTSKLAELGWVGLESPSPAALTSGLSATALTHIVYLDSAHVVDLEVNTGSTFVVTNSKKSSILATGNVTMIW